MTRRFVLPKQESLYLHSNLHKLSELQLRNTHVTAHLASTHSQWSVVALGRSSTNPYAEVQLQLRSTVVTRALSHSHSAHSSCNGGYVYVLRATCYKQYSLLLYSEQSG